MKSDFHRLKVAAVDSLTADAAAVTLHVPDDAVDKFAFQPGQSLTVRRFIDGTEYRRSYSICAPAGSPPRIGVRELPGGACSGWLVHDVRPGDEVEVQPPSGTFCANPGVSGHHVLIAAGSGITPMLSIAASVLPDPESRVTLFYGNRRANSVMFVDELADLKDRYGFRFQIVHVLSREPRGAALFNGRLDAEHLETLLPLMVAVDDIDDFWLCGPFGMVTDAQQTLTKLGVPDKRIHRELFFVEDTAPPQARHPETAAPGPVSEVTVVSDGSSDTLRLRRNLTILDAAQEFRNDLPFACKGGVCGTCRAKVTDGQVDMHRNFALEPDEVADGFVLTCQSFPVSETVTVDFDA